MIDGRTGDLCPYLLPHAGLLVMLPTPEPVEFVGLRSDAEVDVEVPIPNVVAGFDELWIRAAPAAWTDHPDRR